jgi:2-hydroxychromene-2-carboxylate isomerase
MVYEPKHFPNDDAPGTRLIIAAVMQGLDALRLSMETGRAMWELDQDNSDATVLDTACHRAGIDAAALREKAAPDAELDKIWDANTADALKQGVFGAPAYVFADGEIFWGQDRLMFVERKLAGSKLGGHKE